MMSEARKEKFIKDLKNKLNQKAYGNITEETVLIKAFKYFDLDNTGKSDEECFLKTINKIGVTSFEDDEIIEIFHMYDKDNTGEIDYKEFASELFSNKSLSKKQKKVDNEQNLPNEPPQFTKEEEQPNYKEIQGNSSKKDYLNDTNVDSVLNTIREKLRQRGVQGISSIARNFRIVDENNTQTIDFNEFKKACKTFNFGLDDNQLKVAFVGFDRDNTGEIDYDEFIRSIRGEMNEFRQKLVQQAFDTLDVNKNGEISFEEIKNKYNANRHPDVLSGKKTEDEVLKDFMDTFQETYNYLCGTETDNVITIEEFLEYYENVSMTIDDDAYFELLLNNEWKMGLNTTYNNDKKSWNQNDENTENLSKRYQEKFGDKRPGYNKEEEEEKEKNENALIKFINEIKSLGTTSLISLLKLFKSNDDNNSKELELYYFTKALHEFETELTDDEISSVFNYFDKEKTGLINYVKFINAIRGPMSPKRVAIVKEAFKKLDIDKSGQVEITEIKLQYNAKNDRDVKSGKKTEEEAYTEFTENFQMNHDNRVGPRNKRVTLDEFLDYYNFVSMGIEDDLYFIEMVQNEWKINPYYSKVNSQQFDEDNDENNGPNARGDLKNKKKRFGAAAAPFGTDMTPLTEDNKKKNFYPDVLEDKKKESPVEKFRNTIKKRGVRGVMAMRRAFMIADENDSKTLSLPEFIKFCHDYRIPIVGKDINLLFQEFDKDNSGEINYDEFVHAFVGEMNDRRKRLIRILFDSFDKNKTGYIDLDEIRNNYSPKEHPDVLSGKKTEDEVLAEFLDTLQYHFSLLKNNKEEGSQGKKVAFDEFLEFFNNISVGIEDDDYFENMIKSGFNFEERRPKKKGWKSII